MGDVLGSAFGGDRVTRRRVVAGGAALAAVAGLGGGRAAPEAAATSAARRAAPVAQASPVPATAADQAEAIAAMARAAMATFDLKAVILRVTVDGEEVVTEAFGESMTGVPATTGMHFRNGSVAISYMAMLMLRRVDQGMVGLDDPIGQWLPDLPDADLVTPRMLANMTAGYPDYVQNPRLAELLYADPFRAFTPGEQIEIGLSTPRVFAPGTNWDYSHTNYVILGQLLERVAGQPLAEQMQQEILDPLGLTGTVGSQTPAIPDPVLHAFTSERRTALGIPAGTRFYEEATFWNPSWSLAEGAVQTTTIHDMTASAVAVGEGTLLSPESRAAMLDRGLLGFGSPLAGCPACHTLDEQYNYGLGVVFSGAWIMQNPLFAGLGSIEAYLPSKKIAIAVATTFNETAFDDEGNNASSRASTNIFAEIAAYLAPDDPLPSPR